MISIASLIYHSPRYADAVYDSLCRYTPALADGRAEFFFVANDARVQVVDHLRARGIPFVINVNPPRSDVELEALGIGPPAYLHRVYRGWNCAIREARGDVVVLVNSDMMFSPGWLDALVGELTEKRFVTSTLIDPAGFPGMDRTNYGRHPDDFAEREFLAHADAIRQDGVRSGGAYMPCAFRKALAEEVGYYPEGNPWSSYGDQVFVRRIRDVGGEHVTALASVVYHFGEGELRGERSGDLR